MLPHRLPEATRASVQAVLPTDEWREICVETTTSPGRHMRIRLVRCWMYERVTGSSARTCPFALNQAEFRTKLSLLPGLLSPSVIRRLDRSASTFLTSHGVAAQPLLWQPDTHLFEHAGLASAPLLPRRHGSTLP
jgi:hypothetical protein